MPQIIFIKLLMHWEIRSPDWQFYITGDKIKINTPKNHE